jgi:hypothetical protein
VRHQKLNIDYSNPIRTIRIRKTEVGRKRPVVVLKGKEIKTNRASFYVDIGSDISLIKDGKLQSSIQIKRIYWR